MKKETNNTLAGTIETKRFAEKRHENEKYAAIIVTPNNYKEGNKESDFSSHVTLAHAKSVLNAIEDFLLRRRIVNGKFDLYAQTSEIRRTSTLGQVKSDHKAIVDAVTDGKRFVELNVPTHGLISFELPSKKVEMKPGKWEYVTDIQSPFLNLRTFGAGEGKLENTDTNKGQAANTFHFHSALRSLAAGEKVSMYVGYRTFSDLSISTEIHDKAARLIEMLDDSDLNIADLNAQKKQTWIDHKDNSTTKFLGTVDEAAEKAGLAPKTEAQAQCICVIAGKEFHFMEVPNGTYLFADANGKPSGQPYSISRDSDRKGLRFRGEKVYLVATK